MLVKSKNIFAVLANKRKAGSHRKSNKALRKAVKQGDRSSEAEQGAFNAEVEISKFSGPTMSLY